MSASTGENTVVWPPTEISAAPPRARTETPAGLRRTMLTIGSGWLLTGLAMAVSDLPLRLLLKNHLHLGAQALSLFGLVAGIAWYFKPLVGILSDSTPLFGTRRRSYLLLGASVAGALWLLMGAVPKSFAPLLATFTLINAMVVIVSTVLGGLLVEEGQQCSATGRLSSQRVALINGAILVSGPLGGYLAKQAFGLTAGICALCLFGLVLLVWLFLREERGAQRKIGAWIQAGRELKTLFRSGPLWGAAGLICLLGVAPGFGTPLLYYQQDTLKFSAQFMGNLALISGASGLLGSFLYYRLCERLPLRLLLALGIVCSVVSTLFYLGYHSRNAAMLISASAGLVGTLALIPLFDLAARATPHGSEALGYSLMMGASNLTGALSDLFGSWLFEHYHIGIMKLVWLNAGTTALVLLAVPFLPGVLMDRRDGEAAQASPSTKTALQLESIA
jgi:Na+/melibiose symporter-like transporter